MNATHRALLVSFAEKYTLLLVTIAGSMLIARLLTPAEIGVYSVGAVLAGLAQVLRDFGIGQFLVQERELNRQTLRAALAISLGVAWMLALMVFLLSAPLAAFYRAPALSTVLRVLALNFAMLPFSALTLPLLRRQMRFSAIFAINAANGIVAQGTAVLLAVTGHGTLSLAWGVLAGTCASVLVSQRFRPVELPWLPSLRGVRKLLRFGVLATGGGLVDEAGVAAPDLIIGKLLDVAAVGIFSKAMGLLGLFNQAIGSAVSPVLFPLFARQVRDGGDAQRAYLMSMACLTAIAWPFFCFVGLMAGPLVRVLYGPQWDAVVPLLRILCIASALNSMFNMVRYFFVASGHVQVQARLDAYATLVRLAAIAIAAPLGLRCVAWAVLLGALFRSGLTFLYLHRHAGLHVAPVLRAVARSLLLTALAATAPLLVLCLPSGHALMLLVLAAIGAAVAWVLGVFVLKHPIAEQLQPLRRKFFGLAPVSH